MVNIGNSWDEKLSGEFTRPYYLELRQFLINEYSSRTIYPDMYDIFNAFKAAPFEDVRVVIIGQDPYHEPGQAHGMCFSVRQGVEAPPSLKNIYKEIKSEYPDYVIPNSGCLQSWAEQGVLLLNTVLTVRAHQANSHKGKGWESFTDRVIQLVNDKETPVVFLLWGAGARSKKVLVTNPRHCVLEAAHPSPLSAYNGFFGCGHFRKCNEFLVKSGQKPITW